MSEVPDRDNYSGAGRDGRSPSATPSSDTAAVLRPVPRHPFERTLRSAYRKWISPYLRHDLARQRAKLGWSIWDYRSLLGIGGLSVRTRWWLLWRFLIVDWFVLNAHSPHEIVVIARELASRPAHSDEIVVEAGCWQGGSSAKLSLLCRVLGYRLHIYDSFAGVAPMQPLDGEHDFSGEYAAPAALVKSHLQRYGDLSVCEFHEGWFADTLAVHPPSHPVRLAYIDCDVADGTYDALIGVVPRLVPDGCIFSQDCHIAPVTRLLGDPMTWQSLGFKPPAAIRYSRYLVALRSLVRERHAPDTLPSHDAVRRVMTDG